MTNVASTLQKKRERFYFEEFAKEAGIDAGVVQEREAPDLIIRTGDLHVGVEITEFFVASGSHGGTLQARESMSDRIVTRAQRIYEERDGPPVHASIFFWPGSDIRSINRDGAANWLADYVQSLNLAPFEVADKRSPFRTPSPPDEVSFVHALGVPSYDMAHWGVARPGWVAPLTVEALQRIIDVKAGRLATYQKAIGNVWLLVVADRGRPSSLVDVGDNLNLDAITSPFARTFFYQRPGVVLEIASAKAKEAGDDA